MIAVEEFITSNNNAASVIYGHQHSFGVFVENTIRLISTLSGYKTQCTPC